MPKVLVSRRCFVARTEISELADPLVFHRLITASDRPDAPRSPRRIRAVGGLRRRPDIRARSVPLPAGLRLGLGAHYYVIPTMRFLPRILCFRASSRRPSRVRSVPCRIVQAFGSAQAFGGTSETVDMLLDMPFSGCSTFHACQRRWFMEQTGGVFPAYIYL